MSDALHGIDATLTRTLEPLFAVLPLARAMEALVPSGAALDEAIAEAERVVQAPEIRSHPALVAGLWLYVDELDRSHEVSQGLHDPTGSFWHGIMHRREGDFGNSHYWFHKTGTHPAMQAMPDYEPHRFIDAVAAAGGANLEELVALQRQEWLALFRWCAAHS